MRISWPAAARLGGGALAVVLGLVLLPGLLRAPEPPPLDPEIGLVAPSAEVAPRPKGGRREPVEQVAFVRADHERAAAEERDDEAEPDPGPEPAAESVPEPDPSPPVAPPVPVEPPPPPHVPAPTPAPAPIPEPEPPAGYEEFGP